MHDIMSKFNTSQQMWLFYLIFTVLQKIHVSISVDEVMRVVCFVWFFLFVSFSLNISEFAQ